MKKVLLFACSLAMPTLASAYESIIQSDKTGHTFHAGVSTLQGDLSDLVDTTAVYSFGYDYTTKEGAIIGGYYMPRLLSDSDNLPYSFRTSIKSQVLGIYSGYQFDNNIRLTGGLSFTHSKVRLETNYHSISDSETNIGFILGVDYLIKENLLIGSRLSTHEVAGWDGTTIGFYVGYKI